LNGPVSGHPSIISAFVWRIAVEVVHCVTINDILNILHTWTFELYNYIILFLFVCQSIETRIPISHEISLDHGNKTVECTNITHSYSN